MNFMRWFSDILTLFICIYDDVHFLFMDVFSVIFNQILHLVFRSPVSFEQNGLSLIILLKRILRLPQKLSDFPLF